MPDDLEATQGARDLQELVVDPEFMLRALRSRLPALTEAAVHITDCTIQASRSPSSRKAIRNGRFQITYRVGVEVGDESRREFVLLGVFPAGAELLDAKLQQQARALGNDPAVMPFRELASRFEDLRLAILFFPLDPALPGLAAILGAGGARLLEPHLPECRQGARIDALTCELRHYKPFNRAVVRARASLSGPGARTFERTVYLKFFDDERGLSIHEGLRSLWRVARGSNALRVPESLGYDPELRMQVMEEVEQRTELGDWIRRLEHERPLPSGVDLECMDRCLEVVAQSLLDLQRSGVRPGERRTFQDELARLEAEGELLRAGTAGLQPDLASLALTLLDRLEALAPHEEQLVPAHGAFRHKQTLGNEHTLTVIDWDGLCLASPALDAATFLVRLCREPRRRPDGAPAMAHIAASFRRAFLELQPAAAVHLDLYEGLILTEELLGSVRETFTDEREAQSIRDQARVVHGVLDRAEESIATPAGNGSVHEPAHAANGFGEEVAMTHANGSSSSAQYEGFPVSIALQNHELLGRLTDPAHMLAVLQRHLPLLADAQIRVTECRPRPAKSACSRKALREGKLRILYRVWIEDGHESPREFVLLGVAPVGPEYLASMLQERGGSLRDHPAAAPFRELALRVDELQLALMFFPLDPALPALAAITGTGGGRLLQPHLPECRQGARVERIACELRHYKYFDRAVLRVQAQLSGPGAGVSQRAVYLKLFADERGAAAHHDLTALWSAARTSKALRVPEPLGYDPDLRMQIMSEAPGRPDLSDWIKCIEHERPLPDGVDLERLGRCVAIIASAVRDLQRSGIQPSDRRTFQDALDALRKDRDLLRQGNLVPQHQLVTRALSLLERLEALAPREEQMVPSHGAFRHSQTIGDERSLTVIDWDGLCMANPALDAATFLTRLRQEPRRHPGRAPAMKRIASTFRHAFLKRQPRAAAHLPLYEALVLTGEVMRSLRGGAPDEQTAESVLALVRGAELILGRITSN